MIKVTSIQNTIAGMKLSEPLKVPRIAKLADPQFAPPAQLIAPTFPDNEDTEFKGSEFQDTENRVPENAQPDNQCPDKEVPDNQDIHNQNTKFEKSEKGGTAELDSDVTTTTEPSQKIAFPRKMTKKKEVKEPDATKRKKQKAATIKRRDVTKGQIAAFLNPKYSSKEQSFLQVPEEDTLKLLRETNPTLTLKGNEWPVFIFMSIKAYDWDIGAKQRRNGKRHFATEYVAKGAGIAESTAWEAMNRLIAKGFIKLLLVDPNKGNLYHVSPVFLYRSPPKDPLPENNHSKEDQNQDSSSKDSENKEASPPVSGEQAPLESGTQLSDTSNSVDHLSENQETKKPKVGAPDPQKSVTSVYDLDSLDILDKISLREFLLTLKYFGPILSQEFQDTNQSREINGIFQVLNKYPNEKNSVVQVLEAIAKRKTDLRGKKIASYAGYLQYGYTLERDALLQETAAKREATKRREANAKRVAATYQELGVDLNSDATDSTQDESIPPEGDKFLEETLGIQNRKNHLLDKIRSLTRNIESEELRLFDNLGDLDLLQGIAHCKQRREELFADNQDILAAEWIDFVRYEAKRLELMVIHAQDSTASSDSGNFLTAYFSSCHGEFHKNNAILIKEIEELSKQAEESIGVSNLRGIA